MRCASDFLELVRPNRTWLYGAIACIGVAASSAAQSSAADSIGYELRGVITSTDGDPVRHAQVKVIGVDATVVSNDSGQFVIDRLPRGTWVVEFRALGYEPRHLAIGMGPATPFAVISMMRLTVLDSVRVVAVNRSEFARRIDVVGEKELTLPDIEGGSILNAVSLLRPQYLRARPPAGAGDNEAARRGQLYFRSAGDSNSRPNFMGPTELAELTTGSGSLSVSVNEGPPGSPDILSAIPARRVRELRFLRPLEAAARFGSRAASGPVLLVYTK